MNFLAANPTVTVEIGGHTNTIPPHEYSDQLSTDRAKKVAEFLLKEALLKAEFHIKDMAKESL